MLKVVEVAQVEQNNRRKIVYALKDTYVGLCAKKKQLAETQYQASKMVIVWNETLTSREEMEESYKVQVEELQNQLKGCKKELNKEQDCVEKL